LLVAICCTLPSALTAEIPESVVRIYVYEDFNSMGTPGVFGSGAIVSPTQVVTNWHVVESRRKGNKSVQVRFKDGSRSYATVIKQNRVWDVALLHIPTTQMEPYKIGPPPKACEKAQTAGFGYDYEYIATTGTISNKILFPNGHKISDKGIYRVNNAVSRQGDSGGPVIIGGRLTGVLFGTSHKHKITNFTSIERVKKLFGDAFQPSYPYEPENEPKCCPIRVLKLH
jgi:hypothetical protein